ncbi:MAG: putative quinol monooxygenase [Pseudomonas sp.]|uniref:putative quinol monooxygenase n=1 Tax=Pseudomonas sp. TaxID=306 RepID=UPI0033992FC2
MPLTLIATLTTLDAPSPALLEGLNRLIAASRAEPGCLQYDLHLQTDNPRVLVMIEQWRDAAALTEHQGSAHHQAFGQHFGALLQGVVLQHLQRIA